MLYIIYIFIKLKGKKEYNKCKRFITTKMQTNIQLLKSNGGGGVKQYEQVIELTTQTRNLHAFLPNTSTHIQNNSIPNRKLVGKKPTIFV